MAMAKVLYNPLVKDVQMEITKANYYKATIRLKMPDDTIIKVHSSKMKQVMILRNCQSSISSSSDFMWRYRVISIKVNSRHWIRRMEVNKPREKVLTDAQMLKAAMKFRKRLQKGGKVTSYRS